jgi:GTPase SAR1 family protein
MNQPNQEWVSQLAQRYADVLSRQASPIPMMQHHLNTLHLASASLKRAQLHRQKPELCPQIALLGPTQSGKSTLVNLLLDAPVATVSPLAGFTVHAQGYAANCPESDVLQIDELMRPLIRTPADALDATNLHSYVLETADVGTAAMVEQAVVWDTPDFDSIQASSYSAAVYKTAALADIVVLVVSKDKYGDKRVWDMLGLLQLLAKPLIICINKVDDADRSVIQNAFTSRFDSQFSSPVPELILLPYVQAGSADERLEFSEASTAALRHALASHQQQRAAQVEACEHFIQVNESDWLKPLLEERDASSIWQSMIGDAVVEADEQYALTYLNNPDKYETFNRALAELLTLLEIPGIARTLARTREVVTWPARRLLGAGQSVLRGESVTAKPVNQEALVMQQVFDSALITLQSQILEQPNNAWWTALDQRYRDRLPTIRQNYDRISEQARNEFEPQIESAAQALYEQLRAQPTLLNTLRAARASADAAGVALAVKSGGIAAADLIIAPAMLSVTTLLTESALGKYLSTIKRNLKERQRKHMTQQVWKGLLGEELDDIARSLDDTALFAQHLEPALQAQMDRLQRL